MKCDHLFANWPGLSDGVAGAIILVCSLLVLCTSLIFLVKILSGVFKGSVGTILQKFLNAEFPGVFKFLTGYAAMVVGALVTILVQSSSVFTSTLTPLVGQLMSFTVYVYILFVCLFVCLFFHRIRSHGSSVFTSTLMPLVG